MGYRLYQELLSLLGAGWSVARVVVAGWQGLCFLFSGSSLTTLFS